MNQLAIETQMGKCEPRIQNKYDEMKNMRKEEKTYKIVKRVDKLPLETRMRLQKKGIYEGLVIFTLNSHHEIVSEEQSLKLFSQILEESFFSSEHNLEQ